MMIRALFIETHSSQRLMTTPEARGLSLQIFKSRPHESISYPLCLEKGRTDDNVGGEKVMISYMPILHFTLLQIAV